MSERITRQVFLRRAAAGGSILTVPGLLAACGDSPILVWDADFAAAGGKVRIPH